MDENSPEARFNKQQETKFKMDPNIPGIQNTGQGQSMDEQRILNQVRASAPPAPVTPSQGQCPQCNLFHPPVGPGAKCPNAPLEIDGAPSININEIVVKIKDILASQLEQKGVKDIDKFVKEMVVSLMKFCEDYKE